MTTKQRMNSIDRREAFLILGAAGLMSFCKDSNRVEDNIQQTGNSPTPPPAEAEASAGNTVETMVEKSKETIVPNPAESPAPVMPKRECVLSAAQIEGPYFVDEKLLRSDITRDPTDGSVQAGLPLRMKLIVSKINGSSCEALEGATVDIWHANFAGNYSAVTGAVGKKYLRGYQVTNKEGSVEFKTIYPGWYPGRAVHIHFKIRLFSAANQVTYEFTSQIYFEDLVSQGVYALAPYTTRGRQDTTNNRDAFFGGANQMVMKIEKGADGYSGVLDIGVKVRS
jgi:protocatechuate 3,4-dioxygenase beta subunit